MEKDVQKIMEIWQLLKNKYFHSICAAVPEYKSHLFPTTHHSGRKNVKIHITLSTTRINARNPKIHCGLWNMQTSHHVEWPSFIRCHVRNADIPHTARNPRAPTTRRRYGIYLPIWRSTCSEHRTVFQLQRSRLNCPLLHQFLLRI